MFFAVKCSREQVLIHSWQRSMPCDGFGNGMNIFFPVFAISFCDFGSFSGNIESLEHFPRQQHFVLTIFNWNYLDYLCHLVLFAFRYLRCLSESCGSLSFTYLFLELTCSAIGKRFQFTALVQCNFFFISSSRVSLTGCWFSNIELKYTTWSVVLF